MSGVVCNQIIEHQDFGAGVTPELAA